MSTKEHGGNKKKRKKKVVMIEAAILCILVIIAVAVVCVYTKDNSGGGKKAKAENQEEVADDDIDDSASDPILGADGVLHGGGDSSEDNGEGGSAFPYTIPGTDLVIERFAGYSGVFIEDGSDSDISGVAAMVLKNQGSTNVEYVDITMNRDDQALQFKASAIPAGATVVVQEASQQSFGHGTYSNINAQVAYRETFEMSEDQVKVEDTGDNSLKVTNLTGADIPCVRIFYKYYMEDEDAYVGGIAYTAKLTNLAAGESQVITPSHYAGSSSKVVMVRTYDTAE